MRDLKAGWMRTAAVAIGAAALGAVPSAAYAQSTLPAVSRVALVVGEGAYRAGPMPAAPDDAGLVAEVLAGAGFDVTGARDLDGDGLRRAVRDFLDKAGAAGPDGIAVVYLAGRAIQSDGDDFFVPVDARLARTTDVPIETLRLADLTHALAALPIQARVVVVDGAYGGAAAAGPGGGGPANPPGLALMEAEQGELLAFNAAPGTVAPPSAGPYGPYAQALVGALKQGGVPIDEVFARVRLAVNQSTGGGVVPWDSDRLTRSFTVFDRAPGAPAVASAQVPFAALERRPLRDFPPDQAYDVALARDTLPAYSEFLAAFPTDPSARRVRLILAVRREALFWNSALRADTPGAYWTYLARYPKGPHAADARRRLTRLAAAAAPPPRFVPLGFDVPPPGPDEVLVDRMIAFDAPDLPPPPPPPVFLLPPLVEIVLQRPAPPPGPLFLPVPVPVALPYVRTPAEPGTIAPPRGVPGSYPRPRPYARGPNGDGLVVQTAPATAPTAAPPTAPAVPSPLVPAPGAPRVPTAPSSRPLPNPAQPIAPLLPVPPTPPAPPPAGRPAMPPPAAIGPATPPAAPHPPVPRDRPRADRDSHADADADVTEAAAGAGYAGGAGRTAGRSWGAQDAAASAGRPHDAVRATASGRRAGPEARAAAGGFSGTEACRASARGRAGAGPARRRAGAAPDTALGTGPTPRAHDGPGAAAVRTGAGPRSSRIGASARRSPPGLRPSGRAALPPLIGSRRARGH